jgi:DNA-binding NarL/FixJ family response regulator
MSQHPVEETSVVHVFIVDDHPIVRDGLRHLIDADPGLEVSGEAESGEEALKLMEREPPDVAVVDLSLPGMDGVSLIRRIREMHPDTPVLVLSMLEQTLQAERALKAGASGYVTKADATDEVVTAIHRVVAGEIYVSESLAMDIIGDLLGGRQDSLSTVEQELTDREFEIFRLIGRGLRSRQIAEALGRSVKTIEAHQSNIKRKLGLRDARELAYYAMRWREMEGPEEGGSVIP